MVTETFCTRSVVCPNSISDLTKTESGAISSIGRSEFGFSGFEKRTGKFTRGAGLGSPIGFSADSFKPRVCLSELSSFSHSLTTIN